MVLLDARVGAVQANGQRVEEQPGRHRRNDFGRARPIQRKCADAFIVCPRVLYDEDSSPGSTPDTTTPGRETPGGIKRVTVAISSGSLVDLSLLDRVGPHDEKLFIDYVDFEFCLRAAAKGWFTYRATDAVLWHRLGNQREARFLGFRFHPTHHSPDRHYYKTRNMFYVWSRHVGTHPRWVARSVHKLAAEFIQIWLFEDRKAGKTLACARGFTDFLAGRYGPRPPPARSDAGGDRSVRDLLRMAWRR